MSLFSSLRARKQKPETLMTRERIGPKGPIWREAETQTPTRQRNLYTRYMYLKCTTGFAPALATRHACDYDTMPDLIEFGIHNLGCEKIL